jgi:hypothetical protein
MRHRIALIGVVLLTLGLVAGTTSAQQYTIANITIEVKPNPVVFSSPVTISGRARGAGNTGILLQSSRDRNTWTTLQKGRTDKNGKYSFGHRPSRNTYYRVVFESNPTSGTAPLLVRVAMLVGLKASDSTPSAGQRVRFSGIVRPPHNGRRVYLQRKTATGKFVTVKRGTLSRLDSKSSRYAISIRVRSTGVYRARVLGHSDHAQGVSRERTVTVG